MAKFKVGNRVVLRGDSEYMPEWDNPLQGSEFACKGSVLEFRNNRIFVVWDNEHVNNYIESDLDMIKPFVLLSPINLYRGLHYPIL